MQAVSLKEEGMNRQSLHRRPSRSLAIAAISAGLCLALAGAIAQFSRPPIVSAQGTTNLVEYSYRRAREVLDAARRAYGLTDATPGIDDVSFKINGKLYARQQSFTPDAHDARPVTAQLTVDLKTDAITWDVQTSFPGGFEISQTVLLKGDQGTVFNRLLKTSQPLPPPNPSREFLLNRIPQSFLARATARANTLRWLGETDFQGRKHNAISFATASGTELALFFDARTNLLSKFETLVSDPYLGDAVNEFIIAGYQTIDGRPFPTGQILRTGGELAQEYQYSDVRINSHPAASTFEAPAGYTAQTPPTVPFAVKELAKDVYMVEGMGGGAYASLFVAFNDYVLVVEPTVSEATTRTLIQKIKETVPGKPIRYVVATHHHSDHMGGARAFIADGVALVTTPGNVAYFQKFANSRFTVQPDAQQLNPRKPLIETVTGRKRVFTDGTHTVELHDIGPNPHAKELLVVWLPNEKILFEGDMFVRNPDNSIAPAIAATVQFAEAVRKMGIQPATLVDVHSRVYTMQDLQASLDLAKKNTAAGSGK